MMSRIPPVGYYVVKLTNIAPQAYPKRSRYTLLRKAWFISIPNGVV